MDKFKEIIENKKQKSTSRKPRYGTRMLSIGLVSCVLGYGVALTDEAIKTNTAVEESAVPTNAPEEENTEETETTTPTEEDTPVETSEETLQDTNSETSPAEKSTTNTKKAPAENSTTEAEKATEEVAEKKLVTLDEYNALQEENAEASADAEELEISEEADPVALQAGETEESAITNVEITIGGAKNGENTTIVNPTSGTDRIDTTDTDLNLKTKIKFEIPKGTKAGRYFDVQISNNVNFNGIVREEEITPIDYNNEIIATREKLTDGRRGYRYTFNDKIDNLTDISVSLEYPLFIDPETVPNNSDK